MSNDKAVSDWWIDKVVPTRKRSCFNMRNYDSTFLEGLEKIAKKLVMLTCLLIEVLI
jgi:hypothetical protein